MDIASYIVISITTQIIWAYYIRKDIIMQSERKKLSKFKIFLKSVCTGTETNARLSTTPQESMKGPQPFHQQTEGAGMYAAGARSARKSCPWASVNKEPYLRDRTIFRSRTFLV